MSILRWIDKEDKINNGMLLSHKKEWNTAICSDMEEPRDHHTKWSKAERERQTSYNITYIWESSKNDTNEPIYKTDSQKIVACLMVTKRESGEGINRYTLLYIKQIYNKDLLYKTGNYIQYLAVICNGK